MTTRQKILWLLGLTFSAVLPAYGNNPPHPDGLFSILLILPVTIVGFRLAETTLPARRLGRILVGLALTLAVLLSMAGDDLGLYGILVLLIYAFLRGIQIMRYGKGGKRFVFGPVVIFFALLAVGDYTASLNVWPPHFESSTISDMRMLSSAEAAFAGKNSKRYASLEELQRANLIDDSFLAAKDHKGYRYGQFLTPARDHFMFYAVPVRYPDHHLRSFVPGGSLLSAFRPKVELRVTGKEAFAVDETGIIRSSLNVDSAPRTREDVEKWEPLY